MEGSEWQAVLSSRQSVTEIERLVGERFGGIARLVPSGRFALIVAMKAFLQEADDVAMIAPLCEVVAFATYAAGMRPVFVDSAPQGPRLDPEALAALDRGAVRAVIAANLYGIPDALPEIQHLCRDRGWVLIEDCAQVLDSKVGGKRAGTFGEVTILSFRKYFDEYCGVLVCHDRSRLEIVDRLIKEYSNFPSIGMRIRARIARMLGRTGVTVRQLFPGAGRPRPRAPRFSLPLRDSRVPLIGRSFSAEVKERDPMAAMSKYLRVDAPAYRVFPPPARLERLLAKVRNWDRLVRDFRATGHAIEARSGLPVVAVAGDCDPCYLAIPLVSPTRDQLFEAVWREEGLWTENIYTPPLPEYLPVGTFRDLRRFPERDQIWSSQLLPLPLIHADAYVRALGAVERSRGLTSGGASPVFAAIEGTPETVGGL